LPDVRGTDARSAQIGSPDFISQCFQVRTYSIEPFTSKFARNLFSSDDWRTADLDVAEHVRPEVSVVIGSFAFACGGEGLTRAGAGPDREVFGPPRDLKGEGPSTNAREKVDLLVLAE
jgi:hypothetical protein